MPIESEDPKHDGEVESPKPNASPAPAASIPSFSINIWPPSQRTRDAVVNRLIENLSAPSILSKRYGTLPQEEASAVALLIEQAAFDAASASSPAAAHAPASGDDASIDEGIRILQIYSKEVSRRMLESVKARASPAPPSPTESSSTPSVDDTGDSAVSDPMLACSSGKGIASEGLEHHAA